MVLDYSQNLTKEATLLYDMGRKKKVEFTGDCVLGKEADFKIFLCFNLSSFFQEQEV